MDKRHFVFTSLVLFFMIVFLSSCGSKKESTPVGGETPSFESQYAGLFETRSQVFNIDTALLAGNLCSSASTAESITQALTGIGLSHIDHFNYDENDSLKKRKEDVEKVLTAKEMDEFNKAKEFKGTNAFAFGYTINDSKPGSSAYLFIVCRGSHELTEFLGDWDLLKGGTGGKIYGEAIWKNVYDFYYQVFMGLKVYLNNNREITSADSLKVLITGHSLGGAAANALAARIDLNISFHGDILSTLSYDDVYAYTFATIEVLKDFDDKDIESGFDNIHNVYNYFDSFGPNGNQDIWKAASYHSKFGHTEIFSFLRKGEYGALPSANNHLMSTYLEALHMHKNGQGTIALRCAAQGEPVEETVSPTSAAEGTSSHPVQYRKDRVPDGTYVSYVFGVLRNAFTFYGDNEIKLNALGINGTGTYTVKDGEIIVTYTTNISDTPCEWRAPFSLGDGCIYISGDRFDKE